MSERQPPPPPLFLPDVAADPRVPPKEVFLWLQYRAQAAAMAHKSPVPLRFADASALVALGALTASLLRSQLGYAKETTSKEKAKEPGLCPASLKDATTCCWCGGLISRITYACPLLMLLPDALRRTLTLDHVVAARPDATAEELRLQNKRYTRNMWYLCTRKCCREMHEYLKERFPQMYDDLDPRLAFLPRVCRGREENALVSHKADCPMEERLQHHQMYVVTKEDRAESLRGRGREVKRLEKEEDRFIHKNGQNRPLLHCVRRATDQQSQSNQDGKKRGRKRKQNEPKAEEEAQKAQEEHEEEETQLDGSETELEQQELILDLPSPIAHPPAEIEGPETYQEKTAQEDQLAQEGSETNHERGFTTEPDTSGDKHGAELDDSKTEPDSEQHEAPKPPRKKQARSRAAKGRARRKRASTRTGRRKSTGAVAQKRRRAAAAVARKAQDRNGEEAEQVERPRKRPRKARQKVARDAAKDADREPEREKPPKRARKSTSQRVTMAQEWNRTVAELSRRIEAALSKEVEETPTKRARRRPQRFQDEQV